MILLLNKIGKEELYIANKELLYQGIEKATRAAVLIDANVVDAMASFRPHCLAIAIQTALEEIRRGRRSIYDAEYVVTCI